MTMNTLPNFCRVCLKYDKNLIDLAHIENEPSETLMSKLQLCVSEVEWTVFKPLLCHPCIKRLNIAYSFKKQCVQSAGVLKNYVELVKESQKKNESQSAVKGENAIPTTGGAYMLLPNQKYVKILVGSQNQGTNTFQNVFLNLIPATTLNSVTPSDSSNTSKSKDTNQNVFLNLNNTFQKFIPLAPPVDPPKKTDTPKPLNVNVNQLLTESKSEELSVEIDPTVFGLEEEEDSNEEEENNDYDEVISQAKITLKDLKSNGERIQNGKDDHKYYVPILPKHQQDDFLTSGQHFLFSSSENTGAFVCESCQKPFTSKKLLKSHIKDFHLGKMPFKCEYCYMEFATRSEYDFCVKTHKIDSDALNKSLTLRDFANTSNNSQNLSIGNLSQSEVEANVSVSENGEYICDVCHRPFNSSTGLLRHKVRKHNQKNKKKYFIKGMKNAKCDICNREFSTQSYMQLHRKLHLRDDIGYKYKVFGKSKYGDTETLIKEEKGKEENTQKKSEDEKEDSDVKPDIEQNGERIKNEEDSNSEDADHKDEKPDESDAQSVSVKMEVEENSDHEEEDSNNPEIEENSSQNSSQGENHDTDEPMSEEN
ncbi:myoneurin-like [Anoplophora glabripennis]|nr:myoneurin-like [Anoplophora glabripennis]